MVLCVTVRGDPRGPSPGGCLSAAKRSNGSVWGCSLSRERPAFVPLFLRFLLFPWLRFPE